MWHVTLFDYIAIDDEQNETENRRKMTKKRKTYENSRSQSIVHAYTLFVLKLSDIQLGK